MSGTALTHQRDLLARLVALGEEVTDALDHTNVVSTLGEEELDRAITAIGVTADSFIVYFERVKDEMREGRTMRTAVETGWVRARRTILVADTVSLIGAVVLWQLTVGSVRGFAFFLGLSTLSDMIVSYFFARPAVLLLAKTKLFNRGRVLGVAKAKISEAVA